MRHPLRNTTPCFRSRRFNIPRHFLQSFNPSSHFAQSQFWHTQGISVAFIQFRIRMPHVCFCNHKLNIVCHKQSNMHKQFCNKSFGMPRQIQDQQFSMHKELCNTHFKQQGNSGICNSKCQGNFAISKPKGTRNFAISHSECQGKFTINNSKRQGIFAINTARCQGNFAINNSKCQGNFPHIFAPGELASWGWGNRPLPVGGTGGPGASDRFLSRK